MKLSECTTASHPWKRSHTCGADDGQIGWRLHYVDLTQGPVYPPRHSRYGGSTGPINKSPALCGLTPRHGWGLDAFIDQPCSRCVARAEKLGIDLNTAISTGLPA